MNTWVEGDVKILSHRIFIGVSLLLLLFFGDSLALMKNPIISSSSLLDETRLLEVNL
jgi:hypothetical protein